MQSDMQLLDLGLHKLLMSVFGLHVAVIGPYAIRNGGGRESLHADLVTLSYGGDLI